MVLQKSKACERVARRTGKQEEDRCAASSARGYGKKHEKSCFIAEICAEVSNGSKRYMPSGFYEHEILQRKGQGSGIPREAQTGAKLVLSYLDPRR